MPVRRVAIALLLALLVPGAVAPAAGASAGRPSVERSAHRVARAGRPARAGTRARRARARARARAKARAHRRERLRLERLRRAPGPATAPARPATASVPAPGPVRPAAFPAPAAPTAPAPPAGAPAPAGPCADADTTPDTATVEAVRAAITCLVNAERGKAGLPALADDPQLRAAAQGHSDDMVAGGYFAHTSLDGRAFADRIFASGYVSPTASYSMGENIAWGSGSYATPSQIVAMWMGSPGHRANILSARYQDAGVGVALGAPSAGIGQAATYTQDFGAR